MDHVEPTGTLKTLEDLPLFVARLFVGTDKLQVLCLTCHQIKTNKERAERGKGESDED